MSVRGEPALHARVFFWCERVWFGALAAEREAPGARFLLDGGDRRR